MAMNKQEPLSAGFTPTEIMNIYRVDFYVITAWLIVNSLPEPVRGFRHIAAPY
jgi:hypothetical protein